VKAATPLTEVTVSVPLSRAAADRVVLAEPLKAAGYATAMIGKWHVAKKDPAIIKKVVVLPAPFGPAMKPSTVICT
jgi:arylsulfatase A-like enzyme